VFALDIESQAAEGAHVDVRDLDFSEAGEDVTAPVIEQKFVLCKPKDGDRDVVAEAVLAGKQVEKFSLEQSATALALPHAILPRLAKGLFVRYGPDNARHGYGENERDPKLYCVIRRKKAYGEREASMILSVACGSPRSVQRDKLMICFSTTSLTERNSVTARLLAAAVS